MTLMVASYTFAIDTSSTDDTALHIPCLVAKGFPVKEINNEQTFFQDSNLITLTLSRNPTASQVGLCDSDTPVYRVWDKTKVSIVEKTWVTTDVLHTDTNKYCDDVPHADTLTDSNIQTEICLMQMLTKSSITQTKMCVMQTQTDCHTETQTDSIYTSCKLRQTAIHKGVPYTDTDRQQ